MSNRSRLVLVAVALLSVTFSGPAEAGIRDWMRRHMPRPMRIAPPPPHHHAYRTVSHQVWVPPVTQRVFVGYSRFGFPQYDTAVVQNGYYRTVTVRVCSCGHQI